MTESADRNIRADVAEVPVRYATGIDRRDWSLLRSCFADDCAADYGSIGAWHSADEITTWMRDTHDPVGHTMHRITNQVVTANGTHATARSYVDAIVMFAGNKSGTRSAGYYDDELVLTDDGWKIVHRRFTLVLLQLISADTVIDLATILPGEPEVPEV